MIILYAPELESLFSFTIFIYGRENKALCPHKSFTDHESDMYCIIVVIPRTHSVLFI